MKNSTATANKVANLDQFNNFYLMGIKGVAMTSLAQILLDFDKQVKGCDVPDQFVTQKILNQLKIKIDHGFVHQLPIETDCVIYTAAHGARQNPVVQQAIDKNITAVSQAEALAYFFNQKKGIAVCGVGGKSTVSAMLAWILKQNNLKPSFSVGVGQILGMKRTGRWQPKSESFVAEADEYVINPSKNKELSKKLIPRFSFLQPQTIVCTNLKYDHPDVYTSLEQTRKIFSRFFLQLAANGTLIINQDNQHLIAIKQKLAPNFEKKQITVKSFGASQQADIQLLEQTVQQQTNQAKIIFQDQEYQLKLKIPGKFNICNALAASLAAHTLGVSLIDSFSALTDFQGTQRRFEFKGCKENVLYYDDYAHHPHEIEQTIQALQKWHPEKNCVIAFQPHTFSRTKELLADFAQALATAKKVLLLNIFPSAREEYDPNISSDLLLQKIKESNPNMAVNNLKTINSLADFCVHQLTADDVLLTMGAGDIYQVHQKINSLLA